MSERRKQSILIVDAERSDIGALSYILKQQYTVLVAKDGSAALKVANNGNPDLILLDVVMPGMSGLDVLEKLKSDEKNAFDSHYIHYRARQLRG